MIKPTSHAAKRRPTLPSTRTCRRCRKRYPFYYVRESNGRCFDCQPPWMVPRAAPAPSCRFSTPVKQLSMLDDLVNRETVDQLRRSGFDELITHLDDPSVYNGKGDLSQRRLATAMGVSRRHVAGLLLKARQMIGDDQ